MFRIFQFLLIVATVAHIVVMETENAEITSATIEMTSSNIDEVSVTYNMSEEESGRQASSTDPPLFSQTSDSSEADTITHIDVVTPELPIIDNIYWKTYAWNKTELSPILFQQNYCGLRCDNGVVVDIGRIETKCPEIHCFKCECKKPQCEVYGICCPELLHVDLITTMSSYSPMKDNGFPENLTSIGQFQEPFQSNLTMETTAFGASNTTLNSDEIFLHRYQRNDVVSSKPTVECDGESNNISFVYIRSCSPGVQVSEHVSRQCQLGVTGDEVSADSVVRVVDSSTHAVYYNKYCAMCNGVKQFLSWSLVGIQCQYYFRVYTATTVEELLRQSIMEGSSCHVQQYPPDETVLTECDKRWYSADILDTCNQTGLWQEYDEDVDNGCETLVGQVYRVLDTPKYPIPGKVQQYRNIFCAICNKESYPEYDDCCTKTENIFFREKTYLPFSMLLGFKNERPSSQNDKRHVADCSDTEWLSPDGHCLQMHCYPGKVLVNGTCKTSLEQISGLGYHIRLWFLPMVENVTWSSYNIMPPSALAILKRFYSKLIGQLEPLKRMFTLNLGAVVNVSHITPLSPPPLIDNASYPLLKDNGGVTENSYLPNPEHKTTTKYRTEDSRMYDFQIPHLYWVTGFIVADVERRRDEYERVLISEVLHKNINVDFGGGVSVSYTPVVMFQGYNPETYCSEIKETYADIECYQDSTLITNGSWTEQYTQQLDLFLNCTHLLTCSYVTFEQSQYIVQKNFTDYQPTVFVTVNVNGTELELSGESDLRMLAMDNNGMLNVCRELLDEKLPPRSEVSQDLDLVQYILSLTCMGISMTCLFLTLLTYAIFSVLRTLAGMRNVFLCSSLLLAQASTLASSQLSVDSVFCSAIGVSTHFLWLSVMCWSFTCCFHMFRIFTAKTRSSYVTSRTKTLLLVKGITFSMLTPAFIIAAVVVTMYVTSTTEDIGYGGRVCYLNTDLLVGTAMVGPLLLVTLCNTGFFLVTVLHIYRVRALQKQDSDERFDLKNLYIYIKLSTMTGAFWFMSVTAEALDIDGLKITAIMLNGLQGVFIFVSYICNKRVFVLYLRRLGIRSGLTSSAGSRTEKSTVLRLASKIHRERKISGPGDTEQSISNEKHEKGDKLEGFSEPLCDDICNDDLANTVNSSVNVPDYPEVTFNEARKKSLVHATHDDDGIVNPVFSNDTDVEITTYK